MGHQEVNPTYSVIKYYGQELPKEYLNFVRSKWMRSYRFGNDYIKLSDSDTYFAAYSNYISNLLLRPDMVIRMAVLSDDFDVALGFSAIDEDVLHYVHVHKDLRKQGIAKTLIPTPIKSFTHLTRTGLKLWATKMPEAIFNPFQ